MNLGQVYTKRNVVEFMVNMISHKKSAKIVEPCFGAGIFIESLYENGYKNVTGYEIDSLLYDRFEQSKYPGYQFINNDFFTYEDLDTDVFIMNPPYVRQEEIDDMELLGVTKDSIEKKCPGFSIYSKANLYLYFVARCVYLLKDRGELIAIFPNAWLNTPDGKDFYNQLSSFGSIDNLIQVKGFPFVGNPLVDVLILKFTKNGRKETTKQTIYVSDGEIRYIDTCQSDFIPSSNCIPLSKVATVRRGISTGYNSAFINPELTDKGYLVDIISTPKDVIGYTTRGASFDKLLYIRKNDDLSPHVLAYIEKWENIVVENKEPKALYEKILAKKDWYRIQVPEASNIIFPYIIRNSVRFIINDANCIARDNFYTISSAVPSLLLMALLNNLFVFSQLELFGKSYGNGLLKIQKYDMDNIVIPNPEVIDEDTKEKLIQLSQLLINTADNRYILEITNILSRLYQTDNIEEIYNSQRTNRLKYEL